jgi:hypothetical protein
VRKFNSALLRLARKAEASEEVEIAARSTGYLHADAALLKEAESL